MKNMATLKRVLCKYRKQYRFVLLYCGASVFILFWIFGMRYDSSIGLDNNVQGKSPVRHLGSNVREAKLVKAVITLKPRPVMKSSYSRFYTWSDKSDSDLDKLMIKQSLCNGSFVGYSQKMAVLSNVVIDPKFGQGRRGGENISDVLNQSEDAEYYRLQSGYFRLICNKKIDYHFEGKGQLNDWVESVAVTGTSSTGTMFNQKQWVVAVMRYEYANLYHTMTDFYNAFLIARGFKIDLRNITILWIDGHPTGGLDDTWKVLFGNVARASDIQTPMLFDKLVWSIVGYDSPLNDHDLPSVPCIEEFRDFFLTRHGVVRDYKLDCTSLNVLFIWRRNYLAHPRNPTGQVSRKIKNEDELLSSVRALLPGHAVQGLQIDALPMQQQLELIASTDILIGMHGAGLSHTLFLPKHGGLIELFPTYWSSSNRHFRAMAQWRRLAYATWQNSDMNRELEDQYTVVDEKVVVNMVHEMHHTLCGQKAD